MGVGQSAFVEVVVDVHTGPFRFRYLSQRAGEHDLPTLNSATVEVAGRNWLTAQLLMSGFEVSTPVVDRGVDLIVFREVGRQGIRALPLQLKCASGESFGLDRKYEGRGIPLAYIWNVTTNPVVFLMTYEEALAVLGTRATASKSWVDGRKYAVTRVGAGLRQRLSPFESRWEWLAERLMAQPESGAS